jgi:uncharacterized protein DUF6632
MKRQRALQVVLVIVGLFFVAGIFPVVDGLRHQGSVSTGDIMMLSIYVTNGIFLLLAVPNPAAYRSLIKFTAWASFAHAIVMTILGFEMPSERTGFVGGSGALVVIGVVLLALVPKKMSDELASAARV